MGVTDVAGDMLGVPEPTARFLLALFSAYPFAFVYRWMVMKQGAHVQNVFFTVNGMWILYFVYGLHIWHSLLDVVVVYLILTVWGGTLLGVTLTWIVSMGHLLLGYAYVMMSDQVHPISWTIPHCVLVLKLIGLSYNLYDGRKKAETLSEDMKKTALHAMPPFIEVTGFCYFGGSVLAGPQISYVRYQNFVHGRLFDIRTTPSSIPAGLQRMMLGVSFSFLYSVLNQYYPISHLTTQTFADESFLWKLWLVFITGKVALWRYVTVWLIAEGSCIVTGISYGGLKKDGVGEVNWHDLANVYLIKNETCITLQGVVESFNINTNQWISMYVFKRLKWLGNKMLSYAMTLTFVALWHGVWPGYYLNFSMEFIVIMVERSFIALFKDVFGYTLSDMQPVFRLPLTLVAYVFKNIMLMYPVITFMLLSWDQCYKFMSAVYFYAHIVAFFWLLLYYGIIRLIYTPKTKME